jgi:hypothetical protein
MIIIIIKFPCEIIILQIYDRNKYYILEVPDIKGTEFGKVIKILIPQA